MFNVLARDGRARAGQLNLPYGLVDTPVFMPVATAGTLKSLESHELEAMGYQILLANTYHLALRPGASTVESLGGLRAMMGYRGNILTDSGGFQVFSLGKIRSIDQDGVTFRNHLDGGAMRLTPESVQEIQGQFGSTIAMPLDICPPGTATVQEIEEACALTRSWYIRSREAAQSILFGIVQGGTHAVIRDREMRWMLAQEPVGIALGGFSVGEEREAFWDTVRAMQEWPENIPVYAMGVGDPRDLVFCATHGVDMFDCVLPTRNARNGRLYVKNGYYNVRRAELARLDRAPDPDCSCTTCQRYSVGYLRHLCIANELTYFRLATTHNLYRFAKLMEEIRASIQQKRAADYCAGFLRAWHGAYTTVADILS